MVSSWSSLFHPNRVHATWADDCLGGGFSEQESDTGVIDERNETMKRILISLALLGLGGSGFGQEMKMIKAEDLVWKEHPVFKGAQTVILAGDPMKAEMVVQRTKFPPHYRVPPHTHPYAEVVTVLSGNYWNSFGQSFDKSKGVELPPGSVFVLPAGHAHYTWAEDTEVDRPGEFYGPRGSDFH